MFHVILIYRLLGAVLQLCHCYCFVLIKAAYSEELFEGDVLIDTAELKPAFKHLAKNVRITLSLTHANT